MNQYQICVALGNMSTAGSKAPQDVSVVADRLGYRMVSLSRSAAKRNLYQRVCEKLNRLTGYFVGWCRAYTTIAENGVVLLQIPNDYTGAWGRKILARLQDKKGVRLICLIHDVDELRLQESAYLDHSRQLHNFCMERADAIIAHNESMIDYLVSRGVSKDKLINLEIFDYLAPPAEKELEAFDRSVVIAGNLDPVKCGYVAQLGTVTGVNWILYGPNYDNGLDTFENITYCGKVPPDVLPEKLTKGFGVIWDGSSVDSCQGSMGQYLRYNNPHKLSLYLTAGLPVVIWDQAAEAAFVRKHGVGVCVASLQDLGTAFDSIDPDAYNQMAQRVAVLGDQLRNGHYLTAALNGAAAVCAQTNTNQTR